MLSPNRQQAGFTLIEMIIVIIISGIIAVTATRFISHTAEGYLASAQRQGYAAAAVIAGEKISREIRAALPNSVRVNGTNSCVEFIPVLSAGIYADAPVLPVSANTSITVVANNYALDASLPEYLVIYPSSPGNLYSASANGAMSASEIASATSTLITLGANQQFPAHSPARRYYIVTQPVAYCFDLDAGELALFRYSSYGFNPSLVNPPTGGVRSLLVNQVNAASVNFDYVPASLIRNAVLALDFSVQESGSNEWLAVSQEVQIRNVP